MHGGTLRGVVVDPSPTWWASKGPLEVLTWAETITPYVSATETVTQVSASIAPSGSGELQATAIGVDEQTIFLTLTGGVGGRIYTIQFVVTMTDGSVYQLTARIGCRSVLPAGWPPPPPPSSGFGTPIVWQYIPSFNFADPRNSAYLAIAAGF